MRRLLIRDVTTRKVHAVRLATPLEDFATMPAGRCDLPRGFSRSDAELREG